MWFRYCLVNLMYTLKSIDVRKLGYYHAPWRGRHRKRLACVLWGTVCRNNSAIVSSYVYSSNIRENINRLYTTRRSTSKLMEGPWELLSTSQWRCLIEDRYINEGCSVVSELFERNPESVIAKNFRASVLAFKDLPGFSQARLHLKTFRAKRHQPRWLLTRKRLLQLPPLSARAL